MLKRRAKIDPSLINRKLHYYRREFSEESLKDVWEGDLRPVVVGSLPTFESVKMSILRAIG